MERLTEFRSLVSAVRAIDQTQPTRTASHIMSNANDTGSFGRRSCQLAADIISMFSTLKKQKNAYLSLGEFVGNGTEMSDEERNELEQSLFEFLKGSTAKIHNLRSLVSDKSSECQSHQTAVIQSLSDHLKEFHSEVMNVKRSREEVSRVSVKRPPLVEISVRARSRTPVPEGDDGSADSIKRENQQLLEEYEDNFTLIRQSESQVVEISKLLGLFSEKILEQGEEIDGIHSKAVESTPYIQTGTAALRSTAQLGVNFRIVAMLIILLLALVLLALDSLWD